MNRQNSMTMRNVNGESMEIFENACIFVPEWIRAIQLFICLMVKPPNEMIFRRQKTIRYTENVDKCTLCIDVFLFSSV